MTESTCQPPQVPTPPQRVTKILLTFGLLAGAILCVAIFVLLFSVVPKFEEMFADFGADLPVLTVCVINTSNFLRENFPIVFPVGLAILAAPVFIVPKSRNVFLAVYIGLAWLAFACVLTLTTVALFGPLMNLMGGMSERTSALF